MVILTARPELETNRRLADAARARGFGVRIIDALGLTAGCHPDVLRNREGKDLLDPSPDAVLPRIGNWRPHTLLAILETLTAAGTFTPNPPEAIRAGRDHWRTTRLLAHAGLATPRTLAGAEPELLAAACARELGFPVVVKQRRSRMGVGVIRCDTRDHLESVLDSLWRVGDEVVVQELIPTGGVSLRLLVAEGRVVAAGRFTAAPGEWRSNAARGARVERYAPSTEDERLALGAAAALGLGICGVDLFPGAASTVVGEVNPTPGFLHLQEAVPVDIAGAIIDAVGRHLE